MKRSFVPILLIVFLLSSCASVSQKSEKALAEGMTHFDEKAYQEAIASYDKGLRKDGGNAKLLYNKALCLSLVGKTDEAIALCEKAFAIHPHYLRFLLLKAQILAKEGKADQAISTYQEILKLNPGDVGLRVSLMQYAQGQGDNDTARKEAQWLIDYRANMKEAYAVLAKISGEGSRDEKISAYLSAHPTLKSADKKEATSSEKTK